MRNDVTTVWLCLTTFRKKTIVYYWSIPYLQTKLKKIFSSKLFTKSPTLSQLSAKDFGAKLWRDLTTADNSISSSDDDVQNLLFTLCKFWRKNTDFDRFNCSKPVKRRQVRIIKTKSRKSRNEIIRTTFYIKCSKMWNNLSMDFILFSITSFVVRNVHD